VRLRPHTWFALLAAALLIGVANLNGRPDRGDWPATGGTLSYGWPRTFSREQYGVTFSHTPVHHASEFDRAALVIDGLVAAMLLFAVAAVSEHIAPKT
jgi:hypothetical protein